MSMGATVSKESTVELTLPLLQLSPRLLFLPGVVYKTTFKFQEGVNILLRFRDLFDESFSERDDVLGDIARSQKEQQENDYDHIPFLSSNAKKSMGVLREQLEIGGSDDKSLPWIIACLPGFDQSDQDSIATTICQITEVSVVNQDIVLSFEALTRGSLGSKKTISMNEATISVEVDIPFTEVDQTISNKFISTNIDKSLQLLENIKQFLVTYQNDMMNLEDTSTEKNSRLKSAMMILAPLSHLIYATVSSQESTHAYTRLSNQYKSAKKELDTTKNRKTLLKKILKANDVLTSVFPFSMVQKVNVLGAVSSSTERIQTTIDALDFANPLFETYLNVDYVLETWKDFDTKNGKIAANLTRSQLVSNHLKGLRVLIEDIQGTSRRRVNPSQRTRLAPSTNTNPPSQAPKAGESDDENKELRDFINNLSNLKITEDGKRLVTKDFNRMTQMQPSSSEYQLLRTYLEIIMDIPWESKNTVKQQIFDLDKAKETLDHDHYGMDSVKDRILEYLAVLKLHDHIKTSNPKQEDDEIKARAPILLLTGPPGVGKTSLGKSIAKALNKKFQRVSLGGLKDESEIKGHRRTYVGAMPGLLTQALRKSQSFDPVILLDEIDKVVDGSQGPGSRVNGDPSAALLEVLDPEQNSNFSDHYIGFPLDLSRVVFICTSNDMSMISAPLRDRMEVIELNGYNYFEKVEIVKQFLLPKQIKRNGLPMNADSPIVNISDEVIMYIAVNYTREPGIRNLERLIGSICRGKAIEYSSLMSNTQAPGEIPKGYVSKVMVDDLSKYIGIPPELSTGKNMRNDSAISKKYGIVNGLSYNSSGNGSTLVFEMTGIPNSNNTNMITTGRLGDVLTESVKIARTIIRSIFSHNLLQLKDDESITSGDLLKRFDTTQVHMHVPAGAIQKDGPSAGITITLCLLSVMLEKPVPRDLAMTGEITLRGMVLPIGGVHEKLLGAHLTGTVKRVILPRSNRRDVIQDFISNLEANDRGSRDKLLVDLIKEEESLLSNSNKSERIGVFGLPEKWVQNKLGLQVSYVEEFWDVIQIVWSDQVEIDSTKLHELATKEFARL
ncbi:BA75_01366T0 [Komagataella pastoris]|uniref:endopeptidase La n=1 Tax=Komagataella pastoris TaxID=4922 RepID=A0A1B2J8N1_PICPA|nr:BA75_01366T0 [Komagataella pastoris]